jgi:hypothetical protein
MLCIALVNLREGIKKKMHMALSRQVYFGQNYITVNTVKPTLVTTSIKQLLVLCDLHIAFHIY